MKRIHDPGKLLLALCAAAVFACGGNDRNGSGGEAKTTGAAGAQKVFHYFRTSAHKTLDPHKQFDSASAELVSNVYDALLQYHYLKRPYQLEPNLLTKLPELGADGLTYSFELREGVRFHDDPCFPGGKGRTLTSDDVIYSIKRFADANVNVQSYVLMQGVIAGLDEFREQTKKQAGKAADYSKLKVSGITKVDDRHFTVLLTRPNPLALLPLAATQLSIVAREAVEKYGQDLDQHPVGTGPFRMQKLDRRGVTVLERNPTYHGTYPTEGAPGDAERGLLEDAGKRLPLIDRVELPLIEEPQPAMLKFLSGQLDWIGMDRNNFVKMAYRDEKGFHLRGEYAKKFEIYSEPGLQTEYFALNLKDPLLKNKALRQAIAYALDTKTFIEQMRNGRGTALASVVPVQIAGSQRDVPAKWYEHDLAKAKQKLAEAGYPDGKGLPPLTIEYRAPTTETRQDYEFLRAQLAKAGIVLKANFQTFSAYLQKVETGNFQMTTSGWGADYPDAENFYQLLYSPNKAPGPNYSSYANPEYDKLYEQARFMPDGPERHALFARMNEIIREDVPIIITWNPIAVGLHQRWVGNLKRNMMADLPAKYLDIDGARKAKGIE